MKTLIVTIQLPDHIQPEFLQDDIEEFLCDKLQGEEEAEFSYEIIRPE